MSMSNYEKRRQKSLAEEAEEKRKPSYGKPSKFKKGSPEWKKEQNERRRERYHANIEKERERKRKYGQKYKDAQNKRRREKRLKNLEEFRKRERESKRRQREERAEEINARQREFYQQNRDEQLGKILTNRIKREPWLGLRRAADEYSRGNKSLSELTRLVDERVALAAKIHRESRLNKRKRPRENRRDASDSIHSQIDSGLNETED